VLIALPLDRRGDARLGEGLVQVVVPVADRPPTDQPVSEGHMGQFSASLCYTLATRCRHHARPDSFAAGCGGTCGVSRLAEHRYRVDRYGRCGR